MNLIAFGLASALAALPAKNPDAIDVWLTAQIDISPEGRITAMQWQDERSVAQLIESRLEPHIRAWRFEPGRIDGTPQPTRTFLKVHVAGEQTAGGLALKLVHARTGAHSAAVPPQYPLAALRDGVSARVRAEISVDADGKASVTGLEMRTSARGRAYREGFEAAVRDMVARWTYTPERVAGRAVASRISTPIEFCTGTWCQKNPEPVAMADATAPQDQSVALDSVVTLLTPPDGTAI